MSSTLKTALDISIPVINWRDKEAVGFLPLPNGKVNLAELAIKQAFSKTRSNNKGSYNPLPTKNYTLQALSHPESVNLGSSTSLFLNTVHKCFADHYPLGIRPDALLYMILHEIGITVKQNPEIYRNLFTTSKDKQLIKVRADYLNINDLNQTEGWVTFIHELQSHLKQKMPTNLMETLLPPLSTHDVHSETATMVAVLDAASPFYDYLCMTACGIPFIRLFGTPADYDGLVSIARELAVTFSMHLFKYFKYLIPVLEEIADTVAGRKEVDKEFWSSIYNHYGGSGTNDMDGWITAFVNYLHSDNFKPKRAELYDWKKNLESNKGVWGRGINRAYIPNHISCVPFVWDYYGTPYDCRLMGGFLSVQNIEGYATPTLGWAVVRGDAITNVISHDDHTKTVQAPFQTPIKY